MISNKLTLQSKEYGSLISSIGFILNEARVNAYSQVNHILVKTYWEIGRRLVEFEQKGGKKAEYGSQLLEKISPKLVNKFGPGFSAYNLRKMGAFILRFKNGRQCRPN